MIPKNITNVKPRLVRLINDTKINDPKFDSEVEFIKNELRHTDVYRKNQVMSLILKKQKVLDTPCSKCGK